MKKIIALTITLITIVSISAIKVFTPVNLNTTINEINFLDIGQGDSTVISINGEHILIDGGPYSSRNILIEEIKELGISELRLIIATHPHEDHIGGLVPIIQMFDVQEILMPKVQTYTKTFENFLDVIIDKDIDVTIADKGYEISFAEDIKLMVLHPDIDEEFNDINNYSIVAKFIYKDVSMLLTGDAESEVEKMLIDSNADISANILKVGHHGSKTSSTDDFIKSVSPDVAIISCAKDNKYGHPHQQTLDTLIKYNAEVYITAEDGTININLDDWGT